MTNQKLTKETTALAQLSRRNVLKTIVAGSAAIPFTPQQLFCAPSYQKTKPGVALVGFGYYTTNLLAPALQ